VGPGRQPPIFPARSMSNDHLLLFSTWFAVYVAMGCSYCSAYHSSQLLNLSFTLLSGTSRATGRTVTEVFSGSVWHADEHTHSPVPSQAGCWTGPHSANFRRYLIDIGVRPDSVLTIRDTPAGIRSGQPSGEESLGVHQPSPEALFLLPPRRRHARCGSSRRPGTTSPQFREIS
jgi:hypothetical protein